MESKKKIEVLLQKFILNECTQEEVSELVLFFQKNNAADFPGVEEVLPLLPEPQQMKEESSRRIFQTILQTKKEQQQQKAYRFPWKAVAAVLILGLIVSGLFQQNNMQPPQDGILVPGEENITLQLNNGKVEVLQNHEEAVTDAQGTVVASLKGNQLVYHTPSAKAASIEYNTIKVPYGKKFELSLIDGTRVHLNAGTSLKFPTSFSEGEQRQVFLSGEAYFDVARDESRPFIVHVGDLNVQVLGTSFNVSAYPEDKDTEVVLVEGSVGMYVKGDDFSEADNTVLEPGTMGSYQREQQLFTEKEVITGIYTSWIHGEQVFRNMSFENILKKLERNYNIEIVNKRDELNQVAFNANFKDEPIEQILEYFSKIYKIEYTVKDNRVVIQ